MGVECDSLTDNLEVGVARVVMEARTSWKLARDIARWKYMQLKYLETAFRRASLPVSKAILSSLEDSVVEVRSKEDSKEVRV